MDRRHFIKSFASLIAAPAIVRADALMAVRGVTLGTPTTRLVHPQNGIYQASSRYWTRPNSAYAMIGGTLVVSVDGVPLRPGDGILFRAL